MLNMRLKEEGLPLSAHLSQSLSLSLSQVSHLESGNNMDMPRDLQIRAR